MARVKSRALLNKLIWGQEIRKSIQDYIKPMQKTTPKLKEYRQVQMSSQIG